MARIRTIKPEFFTSEDIVSLSPLARLLYVALWCEADKEGRMVWKPKTFKMRYFPADSCDIDAMCAELLSAKLAVLYGDGYAYIPAFKAHQHINPRESLSQLPDPHASTTRPPRVGTREPRDSDAQGGREGKGKEGNELGADAENQRRTKLPKDFHPNDAGLKAAKDAGFDVGVELEKFTDHHAATGSLFIDWQAAWRTWIRKATEFRAAKGGRPTPNAGADKPSWLEGTGFPNVWEANNAGCFASNAAQFRKASV
jgi:hypothetical protein